MHFWQPCRQLFFQKQVTPGLEVLYKLLGALLNQLLGVVSLGLDHLQLIVLLPVQPLQLLALL